MCDKQPSLDDCPSHLTLDLNGISTDLEMNTWKRENHVCRSLIEVEKDFNLLFCIMLWRTRGLCIFEDRIFFVCDVNHLTTILLQL